METREVLSLQFGHYSNFIGTHWWNIQESSFEYNTSSPSEINHEVLFREGLTSKGEVTFTPRLLLVDLKGSLSSLPELGTLYRPLEDLAKIETNWNKDAVEVQMENSKPKNLFQRDMDEASSVLNQDYNLDEEVNVWSDFLYTRFHPRTVNVIKEYEHENKSLQFDLFPLGTNLYNLEQFNDVFNDKIRNYIEECNNFQGFHITLDAIDGFSGLGSSSIEYLRDEYGSKSVLVFPVIPAHHSDYLFSNDNEKHQSIMKDSVRVLNLALCFDALNEHSSLFVPLCTSSEGWRQPRSKREFNHLIYDQTKLYHTSAILASALDTLSLKYRQRSSPYSMCDLSADFVTHGRNAVAASLCLPFSFNQGADFIECLDNWEGPLTQNISPNCSIGVDKLTQMFTLRGIPETRLKAVKHSKMPAYQCNTVEEMLNLYLSCNYFLCLNNVTTSSKAMSVKTPYPQIFDYYTGLDGNITSDQRPKNKTIENVPVLAGLHSGSTIGDMIESLHTEATKIKFGKFHQFISAGLESQEFTECLDRLLDLRDCYKENDNC